MHVLDPDQSRKAESTAQALELDKIQGTLGTQRLGLKFHYFSELASTNSYARMLAESGTREGEVVIAESQTRGRGRLGRVWVSPPYLNMYLSVILRPSLPPARASQLTLMAAVALADAVAAFSPVAPSIKWPNDILVGGKKLAGILTESSCNSARIDYVILGIGVNLNYALEVMPEAIRSRATSLLALAGAPVSREAFVKRLIQDLDRWYEKIDQTGFGAIAAQWQARFDLHGKRVRVEMVDQVLTGTAKGIDGDGALIVAADNGTNQRILAGDVTPLEE
jgi:BirA family biotin operon repressor/biotin-[acetyl-CoA-carboxylase] ligase